MAIVSSLSTITVADIAARDSIDIKTNGMRVIVLDASADPLATGEAIYLWSSERLEWYLEDPEKEALEKVTLTDSDMLTILNYIDSLPIFDRLVYFDEETNEDFGSITMNVSTFANEVSLESIVDLASETGSVDNGSLS